MKLRALLAAIVVALSLAAAGCGGDGGSKEQFQDDVVEARNRVDDALEQVTNATSVDDLLARLRIAAAEVRAAATDVAEADAPDGLDDEERRLANTLRAFSDEIVATVDTLDQLDAAAAETRGLDFKGWEEVQKRFGELRKAGVQVPNLERH